MFTRFYGATIPRSMSGYPSVLLPLRLNGMKHLMPMLLGCHHCLNICCFARCTEKGRRNFINYIGAFVGTSSLCTKCWKRET